MNVKDLMVDYLLFNLWANQKVLNGLKPVSTEMLDAECPSSFPSINKTLDHIWKGQEYYIALLTGKMYHKNSETPIFEGVIQSSQQLVDYVKEASEESLSEKIDVLGKCVSDNPEELAKIDMNQVKQIDGKSYLIEGRMTKFDLIQHGVNHGSLHRGQIVMMKHHLKLNIKLSRLDYLFYKTESRNQ